MPILYFRISLRYKVNPLNLPAFVDHRIFIHTVPNKALALPIVFNHPLSLGNTISCVNILYEN